MSKVSERVTFHESRGMEKTDRYFKRVEIRFSNGELFYNGWIQDFGDSRTGPTVFDSNYSNFNLEEEVVHSLPQYVTKIDYHPDDIVIREASAADLDELIDLNFHNYFDHGYNRISAYQGLNFEINEDRIFICANLGRAIVGFLYVVLNHPTLKESYFDSLYCAPSVRGRGLGHKLIDAGILRAQSAGCTVATGQISGSFNHGRAVLGLLSKSGFVVKGSPKELWPGWLVIDVKRSLG